METKHTPGPWLVMNTRDVFTGLAAKAADGRSTAKDDGWHIADCAPSGSYVEGGSGLHELSLDEIKANARLIAAAPDLLDSLSEIFDYAGGADSALHDEYVMDRARAAIAKAEGK